jgi:hypothetical protein
MNRVYYPKRQNLDFLSPSLYIKQFFQLFVWMLQSAYENICTGAVLREQLKLLRNDKVEAIDYDGLGM